MLDMAAMDTIILIVDWRVLQINAAIALYSNITQVDVKT